MKKNNNNNILAVIPCYNEEATIGSIVLKTKRHVNEVLVIDDGSKDDTAKIAQEAGATVISHRMNRGKSSGIKTGFKYALTKNFDYIITLDGDGQHNPDEIPDLLKNTIKNRNDITIGLRAGNNTEMPIWRRIGKRVLDYATSLGNDGYVTDSQSGFRAFNQKAVKGITPKLNGSSFSVESEQLVRAHQLGLTVADAHITCKYKDLETSTKNPGSHGFSVLSYVIWLVAEKRPLFFISLPGFIFTLFGLFWGIRTLQIYNNEHVFLIPYALLSSIFLILGALAVFIGLMLNVLPHLIKRAREEGV